MPIATPKRLAASATVAFAFALACMAATTAQAAQTAVLAVRWHPQRPPMLLAKSGKKSNAADTQEGQQRKKAVRFKFEDRESPSKRKAEERRLQRECKGRPNAGACLGYAS